MEKERALFPVCCGIIIWLICAYVYFGIGCNAESTSFDFILSSIEGN